AVTAKQALAETWPAAFAFAMVNPVADTYSHAVQAIGEHVYSQRNAQPLPTPQPLPTHVVQPEETLGEIAQHYDVPLTRLMLFNGLASANAITVGQELVIPSSSIPADLSTPAVTATAAPDRAVATAIPTLEGVSESTTTGLDTAPASDAKADDTADVSEERATIVVPADLTTAPDLVDAQIASLNRTYTVVEGDTFPLIALRTGVNQEALRQLNRIDPEHLNDLYVGQTLFLPATGDDLRVKQPAKEYVVQPGDSLGSIANQFELSLADLLGANFIADPDSLAVGQHLTIPKPAADESAESQQGLTVGPARSGYYYYTVQPGDSLSAIAKAFDTSKLALLEYNGLPDEETVYSGIELRIPYGPPSPSERRPPVPASGTTFVVSLSRQQCWLFHGDRVKQAWPCSTGYGEWITRTGTFAVQSKIDVAKSSAYRLDMPYWLGIYNVGDYENGIHGLPVDWDTGKKIWEGLIGEPATFGCAMLNDQDAAELFATAYIGMPIHVTN
ncbi:MAG: LysM peptidoglycan-binding domain-containing protein, partial [Caldilineaceae bacterium]|nr:LysM peptidoglycan-binding domain-containing protein [Caldilineaceae bacterium]